MKFKFKEKRAITLEEHQRIIAAEVNPERKTLYQLCSHLRAAVSKRSFGQTKKWCIVFGNNAQNNEQIKILLILARNGLRQRLWATTARQCIALMMVAWLLSWVSLPSIYSDGGSHAFIYSLRRIERCDQSEVECSAKRAPNPTPLSSQKGWCTSTSLALTPSRIWGIEATMHF